MTQPRAQGAKTLGNDPDGPGSIHVETDDEDKLIKVHILHAWHIDNYDPDKEQKWSRVGNVVFWMEADQAIISAYSWVAAIIHAFNAKRRLADSKRRQADLKRRRAHTAEARNAITDEVQQLTGEAVRLELDYTTAAALMKELSAMITEHLPELAQQQQK
ncbi:hypothetical protein AWB88_02775 [Mycobacterium paraense]|nr:hypothetical protein AWB88_02775 [Mycobacterium paraense]